MSPVERALPMLLNELAKSAVRPDEAASLVVDNEPVSAFAVGRLKVAEARLGRSGARTATCSGALTEGLTDREMSILQALQDPRPNARSARRCFCRSTRSGVQQEPLPQARRDLTP